MTTTWTRRWPSAVPATAHAPRRHGHRRLRLAGRQGRPGTVAYLTAENEYTRRPHGPPGRPPGDGLQRDQGAAPRRPTCRCRPARAGTGTTAARSRASSTAPLPAPVAAGEDGAPGHRRRRPLPARRCCSTTTLEAGDSEFFALGTFDVSPDGNLLAYSVDLDGDERFTLRVKDLRTGDSCPTRCATCRLRLGLVGRRQHAVLPDRGRGVAARPGLAARARHRRPATTAGVGGARRAVLGRRRASPASRGVHHHRPAQQAHQRGARDPGRTPRCRRVGRPASAGDRVRRRARPGRTGS